MEQGRLKLLDEQFESFLDSVTIAVNETELTPEKRALRRKLADDEELEFCKIYFPGIFNEPWNDVHLHISSLVNGNYFVSGSRRYGKSAYTYVGKVIRRIAKGNGGLIGIGMRTTEKGSKERTAALVRLIRRNKMLCYDYDINIQQDLKGHYIINNTTLMASSPEIGLRNMLDDEFKRFSLFIGDDLYNRQSVSSENDNERIYAWITSEVWGQMELEDALSIILGNALSPTSPMMKARDEFPDLCYSLPAVNTDGETNWKGHSKFTKEYWDLFQTKVPLDVWFGDFMDEPILIGDIFKIEWIKPVNVNTQNIIASITAVDPSTGQSPEACNKACITMGITDKNENIVLDIWERKEGYKSMFDHVQAVRERYWHWKTLMFEDDFNQWGFAQPYYLQWAAENKIDIPIWRHLTSDLATQYYGTDKQSRIMNLVFPHQSGRFFYNADIVSKNNRDYTQYLSEYFSFGKAKKKLDGLDACATAFVMLPRWLDEGSFKPLKTRRFRANDDEDDFWETKSFYR